MEKRKLNRITAGFIVLVVMVLILMFSNSLRRSSHITLPEEGSSPGQTEDDTNASGGDALTVIAVTPETVQTAIETLTRPRQYSRVIRVEQLWDGGSGSFETTVTVSGRWTRTDRSLSDGQVRHTITDGEITYIWYGSESSVYSAPAGDITPDDEQAIPTYETILDLPVEDIAAADYRSVSDVNCIYVETVQDPGGLHPTVLGQRGDRLTGSVGTAAGGGDHLPHGIPDGRSEHPLHRPVYPAGRHGAAGHMRRTPTGDSRPGVLFNKAPAEHSAGAVLPTIWGMSAAGAAAGTAAAVTAAITAAAALSSAAEAGTEGKRQPDAQGRQDQNFQHGSLLYPSSSAAMW